MQKESYKAKKIRKMFRKDVHAVATSNALDLALQKFIKPCPKFWPRWFYAYVLRQVIGKINPVQK